MTTEHQPKALPHMNGRHRHTYEAIFRQPTIHNLEWHDVRSLLTALEDVTEGHNGNLQVHRNGRTITLHIPKHKDVASVAEVLAIRHFLEKLSETVEAAPDVKGVDLIVVIDHHGARIYRTELRGAVPQHIEPYDPHGFGRHLHSKNPETAGIREPERRSFHDAIAATLRGAGAILIFGSGTGESSAMEQLLTELKHHHHDVAGHIIGSFAIDEHHLTEGQLLAQARETLERLHATESSANQSDSERVS